MNAILNRIERDLGIPDLAQKLAEGLAPTDLQSLLLQVYRLRALRRRPADLLADFETNRFTTPAELPPEELLRWEVLAYSKLPAGFETLTLAPVAPFAVSAVLGSVDQNWVVSTARNTEVISDSTNVLALEAALRRRELLRTNPKSAGQVRLAAGHRLLRAQKFDGPNQFSHFSVFSLVTAGRSRARGEFEQSATAEHICFYLAALRAYLPADVPVAVSLTDFGGTEAEKQLVLEWLTPKVTSYGNVSLSLDQTRTRGQGYYKGLCFNLEAQTSAGAWISLVDGGKVDWTQKLLSSKKERLLISGIGSDRLCLLFGSPQDTSG